MVLILKEVTCCSTGSQTWLGIRILRDVCKNTAFQVLSVISNLWNINIATFKVAIKWILPLTMTREDLYWIISAKVELCFSELTSMYGFCLIWPHSKFCLRVGRQKWSSKWLFFLYLESWCRKWGPSATHTPMAYAFRYSLVVYRNS